MNRYIITGRGSIVIIVTKMKPTRWKRIGWNFHHARIVRNQIQGKTGVRSVTSNDFSKIFPTGPVEMSPLTGSFKRYNQSLRIISRYWNGYLMIDLKRSNISTKEDLVPYTK